MKNSDRAAFAELLASVHALYRVEVTPGVAEIWWQGMKQFDLDVLREAFGRHSLNPDAGQFPPKPADIVREMGGTTQDRSMLAWAKVIEMLRAFGTYESVAFDDPIIHRVLVDLGGWAWFGEQQESEMPFIEKRFRDAYRAWLHRGLDSTPPQHLVGRTELANVTTGFREGITVRRIGQQRQQIEERK